jgi:hypothetical protein
MKLIKNTMTMHGGKEVYLLIPQEISEHITAGHDNKGFVVILGNGSGYSFLAECFAIASELQKNEILYLPVRFKGCPEFEKRFSSFAYNLNIIFTNYCSTQISIKDIEKVLQINALKNETITRGVNINKENIERWKTDRRLTVKMHKKNLYIVSKENTSTSIGVTLCYWNNY